MKRIEVKESSLKEVIEFLVEGFNDCACCPLYYDCPRRDEGEGIDIIDCANEIIVDHLQ